MKKRYAIKQLATKIGRKPKDMLVLTQVNDPFYIGSETQCVAAGWARKLYELMGRPQKVLIRRLTDKYIKIRVPTGSSFVMRASLHVIFKSFLMIFLSTDGASRKPSSETAV
jgi:hypothetical protein